MSNKAPAIRRVQVGLILRNLRRDAGVSPPAVNERLDWYGGKLTKVEKGELAASAAEVEVLIDMYGVHDPDAAERLRALGKEARRRDQPASVPDWASTYLALEGAASDLRAYDPEIIPAVLQTEHYARALLSNPLDETHDPEPGVTERMNRADRTLAEGGPELWVVLGEAVLHRPIGDYQVLRHQIEHLQMLARKPNVTIQVLPFSAGVHVALGVSFKLVSLTEPPSTFVYTEGLTTSEYLDKTRHVNAYVKAFDRVRAAAASDRDSVGILDRRIKDLRHSME